MHCACCTDPAALGPTIRCTMSGVALHKFPLQVILQLYTHKYRMASTAPNMFGQKGKAALPNHVELVEAAVDFISAIGHVLQTSFWQLDLAGACRIMESLTTSIIRCVRRSLYVNLWHSLVLAHLAQI